MAERREQILVVDDEPHVRDLYQRILAIPGIGCELVESGQAAIERVEAGGRYLLALIDYVMPGLDGAETATRLKAVDPELVIVFATGSLEIESLKALELTEDLLVKPFRPRDLLSLVDRLCEVRRRDVA